MGAHQHSKENRSDRARLEKLRASSKKTRGIHGEGTKNPKPKGKKPGAK